MKPPVETFVVDGVVVEYKLQRAKDDRQSLLVLFSGFRSPGTYDFDGGPAQSLRGNVLWIQDQFEGGFSYYMCRNMDFSIADAVQSLIKWVLESLEISKDQCILGGFSKGGSAALYHGIRYDYGAIVASAPQFNIGSYMGQHWPKALTAMVGNRKDLGRRELDELLPAMITEDVNRSRHIYLVSSHADELHAQQIEPFIHLMRLYPCFNYVLTDSPLVQDHIAVTQYNVPFLTGLFALLIDGMRPRLGEIGNGSRSLAPQRPHLLDVIRRRKEVVARLTSAGLQGGRFYPAGYAFAKGFAADNYGCVRRRIVLRSGERSHEFALGGVREPRLSSRFYDLAFCDYSHGAFATEDHKGIDLGDLPVGTYKAELVVEHEGIHASVPCLSEAPTISWGNTKDRLIKYESNDGSAVVVVRPLVGATPVQALFKLSDVWARDTILHIEGHFAVKGIEAASYADVDYYLLFEPVGGAGPRISFQLAVGNRLGAAAYFDDPWMDYSKAYFATPNYKGIDIAGIEDGSYELSVSARFRNAVYTLPLEGTLVVSGLTIISANFLK